MLTHEERRVYRRNMGLMVLGLFLAGCVTGYVIALWWPV